MATSIKYTGLTGEETSFPIGFSFLKLSDIKVQLDGAEVPTASYTVENNSVVFNTAPSGTLTIYRDTNVDNKEVVFTRSSPLRASDLNKQNDQTLYKQQEMKRALMSPPGEEGLILQPIENRNNRLQSYDDQGLPVAGPFTSLIEGLLNLNSDAEDWGLVNEGVDEVVDWGSVA